MSLLPAPTSIYSACLSINSPDVTTRVGPLGHTIIYHQPTQESSSASPVSDTFTHTFSNKLMNILSVPPSQHLISFFSIPLETSWLAPNHYFIDPCSVKGHCLPLMHLSSSRSSGGSIMFLKDICVMKCWNITYHIV